VVEISDVRGTLVYTSRGSYSIEVTLVSKRGFVGRFASPSGASTGEKEVPMFPGNDVGKAFEALSTVSQKLVGFKFESQAELDGFIDDLDGTGSYEKLGAAVSLGLSMAGADVSAMEMGVPLYHWLSNGHASRLPLPLGNIIGGGKHARGRSIDIQEILVFPREARSYQEAFDSLVKVHKAAGMILAKRDRCFTGGKNDEGAWTTSLNDEEALEIVIEAMDMVSGETGINFSLGVDVAASSLWDRELGKYYYPRRNLYRDGEEQLSYILELIDKYELKYVEDPLEENDFTGFARLTEEAGDKAFIVGDDLFVTNKSRVSLGVEKKSANGIIIKPNQVGDLTKAGDAVAEAGRGGLLIVVSHRSGETPYPQLAHVAIAFGATLFKCGVVGGERVIKHNEIIRIENEFGGLVPSSINK